VQKHVFRNIGAILLYAFAGTAMASFITGYMCYAFAQYQGITELTLVDCFEFGALISATDPVSTLAIFHDLGVDPNLFALVFGESILNDASSIVLYRCGELHVRSRAATCSLSVRSVPSAPTSHSIPTR
jgi:NhaP-type Na+/H+ or K+/H+ antiporter